VKKIAMDQFMEKIRSDPAARERLAACAGTKNALDMVRAMAREQGYTLEEKPAAMQAISDDDLSSVAGGRDPFLEANGGELNPYSWFVSLLRNLFGIEDDRFSPDDGDSADMGGAFRRR
jgi:predicted ribosomally synthesized peptide with nif11-like leader